MEVITYCLKYPGTYIEQVVALTIGYRYPLDEPCFVNGSIQTGSMATLNGAEEIDNKNLTFIGDDLIKWFYSENGNIKVPLFVSDKFFYKKKV